MQIDKNLQILPKIHLSGGYLILKNWTSHAEYQQFIISNLSSFYKTFLKRIVELEPSKSKLYYLDLDILGEILKSHYSNTGRPATFQPEIFRLFSLMLF